MDELPSFDPELYKSLTYIKVGSLMIFITYTIQTESVSNSLQRFSWANQFLGWLLGADLITCV